jgi:glycosyltransferase involved in cell wall biosynthesis
MLTRRGAVKILLVSHRFPPEGTAGTETYTAALGAALVARGHAVTVFAAAKDISAPDLSIRRREHAGIPVHEVVNNLFHRDFRETWHHARIDRIFEDLLDRVAPDVVHFQHLLYLSSGCVPAAGRSGTPVLFKLNDYWLQCPRYGQRLHPDGGRCETIDFRRCGTCLPSFKFAQTPVQRRVGTAIASVRSATGIDLGPLARSAAQTVANGSSARFHPPEEGEARAMAQVAEDRSRDLHERIVPNVDLFLAPSRFLRERFVREWGIPPEKIEHVSYGIDLGSFRAVPRTRAPELRVAFIGSLIEAKGPHLLLEAWGRIAPELRARGSLVLHGPELHEPEFLAQLGARAKAVGARLLGPLTRAEVPRALASIDLLVVPSLWFENAPLIIHEAFAAGTPLLVSDLGGMAELVEEGRGGWRFRVGDAEDLARRLSAILLDRSALDTLSPTRTKPVTFEDHAAAMEARYRKPR